MINSTFDVGAAAEPTEKKPETQFQINEVAVRQKASKVANTYQALRQPQNPESWKSEWDRTQTMIVQLLNDLERGAAGRPAVVDVVTSGRVTFRDVTSPLASGAPMTRSVGQAS